MAKGTVCLTFDYDAISSAIYRGTTTPAAFSRGEFSTPAVPRILHLLRTRGIKSTWFIPGHTVDTYPDRCREVAGAGHEMALHGYLHEPVGSVDEGEERRIFRRAFDSLTALTGERPRGNRTPSWDFSDHTVDIMLDLGLLYDSSLMADDYTPYFCRGADRVAPDGRVSFGSPTDLVQLPVSWSLDDYPPFEYVRMPNGLQPGLRSARSVFQNWMDDIVYMLRDFSDGVLVVTFHPHVIGRGHRLLALERWIDQLLEMGVEFDRCNSVAAQFKNGRKYGVYQPAIPVQ